MDPMVPYPSSSRRRLRRLVRHPARLVVAVVGVSAIVLAGCSDGEDAGISEVTVLTAEVVAEHPADTTSFVQGLEVMPDGDLLVSTGLEGRSRIYRTPITGGEPTVSADLDPALFGEGSTRVGDTIWQLTWKNGIAVSRDATTLEETGRVSYEGEGWGLCSNGERLVMSDGSDRLTFRDPSTFAVTGTVDVTLDGAPVDQLNELDCSDGVVWANVWQSDRILRINPTTGEVTGVLDTSSLDLPARERPGADVLNGIAKLPDTGGTAGTSGTDRYLLSGKLWDTMYEVQIGGQ